MEDKDEGQEMTAVPLDEPESPDLRPYNPSGFSSRNTSSPSSDTVKVLLLFGCCGCCIALLFVGMGAAVLSIWKGGTKWTPEDQPCPVLEPQAEWSAKKQILSRWNWKYKVVNDEEHPAFDATLTTRCPSKNGAVYGGPDGDQLIARQVTGSYMLDQDIVDCHNKVLYTYGTDYGAFWAGKFTRNTQWVIALPGEENKAVGYADEEHWFKNRVEIKDPDTDEVIVEMERKTWSFVWEWKVKTHNLTHPMANPMIVMIVMGRISFHEDDGSPLCSTVFTVFLMILIVSALLVVLAPPVFCLRCLFPDTFKDGPAAVGLIGCVGCIGVVTFVVFLIVVMTKNF